ncbi:MAG: DUF1015 domain-containing protein [Clostridiales bacterium]|jgi:hypothetical protein|nr:DUF1015 domain-containing protein [Clostridiales bacterium]
MKRYENTIGVQVPSVLLPKEGVDLYKWAVVACDQYTAQTEYWEETGRIVGEAPSALKLILPEAYLNKPGETERIARVKRTMQSYLDEGLLENLPQGFILVRRRVSKKERLGLMLALDLERYDFQKGAKTLIRATEGTVVERIPPRLRIREGAPIELPHILVLIDDPGRTVIEPLYAAGQPRVLYDTDLMQRGGRVTGYLVDDTARIEAVIAALEALADKDAFAARYGAGQAPLLFAMGDGNHSFATAKTVWENIKKTLPHTALNDHPARYALVEIENVHDDGIEFEPIHRILLRVRPEETLRAITARMQAENGGATLTYCQNSDLCSAAAESAKGDMSSAHILPFYTGERCGFIRVDRPARQLAVGTLQSAIDAVVQAPGEVDYIHGEFVMKNLAGQPGAIGFLLPSMQKSALFKTVVYDGALPRKTFSMGEANEKRYYMECRRII